MILDLSMPGMNGAETLRHLRALDPEVRVLLSSGYDESEVAKKLEDSRPAGFIKKPYRPEQLVKKVRGLLQDPCVVR